MKPAFCIVIAGLAALAGCGQQYDPMQFAAQGDQIVATGTIDHTTLDAFLEVTQRNPDAKTLVLSYIEGSMDDDANVVFSRVVHEQGFDTIVPSDGLIASGGTDLFLAGKRRVLEPGACVGVHSWGGWNIVATEIPEDDPEHDRYLDYFEDIGVDEAFYWYTLDAAPSEGMHWMSASEADRFEMTTGGAPRLGSAAQCDAR
ncbi:MULTISPECIES: alpha/beta hydrolase [unclassified Ruegeria]|uniref:COG3904 family protein n=1 Tax=unclassified Ruegeria TaxID=2625375 RepID=UPI001FFE1728|nr:MULTISPECIES: alpha/beta hydrolase [unclassified Ruegeria]